MDIRIVGFDYIRSYLIRLRSGNLSSKNIVVMSGVFFEGIDFIDLSSNISFNQDCFISGQGGLKIQDNVSIGHRCSIVTSEHNYADQNLPIRDQGIRFDSVEIASNVWIGANVTILSGSFIPSGSIIGAGSIVNKKLTIENAIYAGAPARFIKHR